MDKTPMSHDLDEALSYLLEEEGGWSDNKDDRGGKTMFGVIQGTYDSYRKGKNLPIQPVSGISHDEARDLYDTLYWKASSCHLLAWPISYLTFDAAVNSGTGRGLRWTQAGLGLTADGVAGPKTVSAANLVVSQGDSKSILAILDQRVQFLASLVKQDTSQLTFLLGWWRRTQRVLARALLSELS
jgi:lysozyme family protein